MLNLNDIMCLVGLLNQLEKLLRASVAVIVTIGNFLQHVPKSVPQYLLNFHSTYWHTLQMSSLNAQDLYDGTPIEQWETCSRPAIGIITSVLRA